ncbi:MAG TPA: 3-deoxy-8-phosphooctulonate synthase [Candidatus Gastranaerophilales bacterium]|nr:3-deoxy-8-phosphooctulonate synthase [Candidatus Gastranaerophilales bacterium]
MNIINKVNIKNFSVGNGELVLMAGPCVIENDGATAFQAVEKLKEITANLNIPFVFKASYDKANRTSLDSYRGPGIEKGLEILAKIKETFETPIVTDIHTAEEAAKAAEVADILQIPAYLCRQTDLLVAAAKTNRVINIKKGQFLAPLQVEQAAAKVKASGNNKIIITDRGTCFGYGNLVSDMRAIPMIQGLGYPVIFDATHSVQLPGGAGNVSSGQKQFVSTLAKAALASGADGLFMEVHPDPENALSDGANMIPLSQVSDLLKICKDIFSIVHA